LAQSQAELQTHYAKTMALPEMDPHQLSLRPHALPGRLQGVYSARINLLCRITLVLLIQDWQVIPLHVVGHDNIH